VWWDDSRWNVAGTRAFLETILPGLYALKPLVEAGIVCLLPSHGHALRQAPAVEAVVERLTPIIASDPADFCRGHLPVELAFEDNLRGTMIFAGGNREEQVISQVRGAVRHFAREWLLSTEHGYSYCAPFQFESEMCSAMGTATSGPSHRVVRALLETALPEFRDLSPAIIAKVRDDAGFGEFRAELHGVYRDIPMSGDISRHVAEAEKALLLPKLINLRKSVATGPLSKAVSLAPAAFRLAATFATQAAGAGLVGGTLGAKELFGFAFGAAAAEGVNAVSGVMSSGLPSSRPVWTELVAHQRTAVSETRAHPSAANYDQQEGAPFWGVPEKPSLSVHITSGALVFDSVPKPPNAGEARVSAPRSAGPRYRTCDCGSGTSFKFCCERLPPPPRVFQRTR
ncbi:MAG: hypothetical protein R3B97_18140, partial [Dehalococcoidia bacterium]